ncbi:MAG: SAM domain and HD, partial [Paramarteilia canceri]
MIRRHGPYSHDFETALSHCGINFKHENQSFKLFDYIVDSYQLKNHFKTKYNFENKDFELIKYLITGNKHEYF